MAAVRSESLALHPGRSVVLKGSKAEGEEEFSINLCSGETLEDGCALHLNARPKDGKLVLNSLSGGAWGEEEREKLSIGKDGAFLIRVRCRDSNFDVYVDRKKVTEFPYRLPLETVKHLLVKGAVQISETFSGGEYLPLPYSSGISGGLGAGRKLLLHAAPVEKGSVDAFKLDLKAANGDVLLHFNARFGEKAVVRNSEIGGEWGPEERAGDFPFDKKHAFEVDVTVEDHSFQIGVNGEPFCTFAHRGSPASIATVAVDGDIEIHDLRFH